MSRISVNATNSIADQSKRFYGDEILAHFQARQKAVLKDKESVPTDLPNRVSVRTINPRSSFERYFVEFASTSTIHGLSHLVAPNRHPVERFLALLFIVGALVCLIFLSFIFWHRYQNNATVIVVDKNRDQFKIPKPALIICPVPNIEEDRIPSVFEKYGIENTEEARRFFTFLANVNYENMSATPLYDKVPPKQWLAILHDIRKDIGSNIMQENDPYETWMITERGLCLATRSYFAVFATLDYWTNNNQTKVSLPTTVDEIPYYTYNDDGAKESIAVKGTAMFSTVDPFGLFIFNAPINWIRSKVFQRVVMSISRIKTKSSVQQLSIHQRKCKFFTDGGLKTWPGYTLGMCINECRVKVIQDRCKCRPHFFRPEEGVDTCNATQLRCIGGITSDLFLYKYPPSFCGCFQKCNTNIYHINVDEKSELYDAPLDMSVITLIVEFPQVIYYRSLLYGFTDFLTSIGGAAGLFLGASVLSFVEILYYATLRAYCYVKRIKRRSRRNRPINLS